MPDNDATIETLQLQQLRIVKDSEVVRVNVDFRISMMINAHTTSFSKTIMPNLPANLQADVENLWNDMYEYLHDNHFDLDL